MLSFRLATSSVPLLIWLAACSARTRDIGPAPGVLIDDAGAPEPAACEGRRCSRDLHEVLDNCTGTVLETCSSESGCAYGACVPACSSAAAARGSVGCSFAALPIYVPADMAPVVRSDCVEHVEHAGAPDRRARGGAARRLESSIASPPARTEAPPTKRSTARSPRAKPASSS